MKPAIKFSAVEAVVVVLIIAVLIGLMLPATQRVRESSRAAAELNAARQAQALAAAVAQKPDIPRRIIYTATVELAVDDLDASTAKVRQMVGEYKGYVSKAEVSGRAGQYRRGTLTVRVPADRFQDAVATFAGLGQVVRTSTDSQDVTEEFIDADARLKNYKAEEAALNKLLESAAGKLEDVLRIREQVAKNRAEIERLEGRLKYLADQTELSTITLEMREDREYTPPSTPGLGSRVVDVFRQSVAALKDAGEFAVLAAVAVAPWLPLALVAVAGGRWLARCLNTRPASASVQSRQAVTSPPTPVDGDEPSRT
jgi:type II secretory pathway pseudopilin PulG